MRKGVILTLAGALVLGVGILASAQSSEPTTESESEGKEHRRGDHGFVRDQIGREVLADLVEDGTITQAQMDAILAAFEAKKAELEAERSERVSQWKSFWEDGVLTVDEIEQLPISDKFLDEDGPFAEALQDGQITEDELGQIKEDWGHRHKGHKHHHGWKRSRA